MHPKPTEGDAKRRALGWWRDFNSWWRGRYQESGQRPRAQDVISWHSANAREVWKEDPPTLEETISHAKCLRSPDELRDYFARYKARKAGLPSEDLRKTRKSKEGTPTRSSTSGRSARRRAKASKSRLMPEESTHGLEASSDIDDTGDCGGVQGTSDGDAPTTGTPAAHDNSSNDSWAQPDAARAAAAGCAAAGAAGKAPASLQERMQQHRGPTHSLSHCPTAAAGATTPAPSDVAAAYAQFNMDDAAVMAAAAAGGTLHAPGALAPGAAHCRSSACGGLPNSSVAKAETYSCGNNNNNAVSAFDSGAARHLSTAASLARTNSIALPAASCDGSVAGGTEYDAERSNSATGARACCCSHQLGSRLVGGGILGQPCTACGAATAPHAISGYPSPCAPARSAALDSPVVPPLRCFNETAVSQRPSWSGCGSGLPSPAMPTLGWGASDADDCFAFLSNAAADFCIFEDQVEEQIISDMDDDLVNVPANIPDFPVQRAASSAWIRAEVAPTAAGALRASDTGCAASRLLGAESFPAAAVSGGCDWREGLMPLRRTSCEFLPAAMRNPHARAPADDDSSCMKRASLSGGMAFDTMAVLAGQPRPSAAPCAGAAGAGRASLSGGCGGAPWTQGACNGTSSAGAPWEAARSRLVPCAPSPLPYQQYGAAHQRGEPNDWTDALEEMMLMSEGADGALPMWGF